VTGDTPAAEPTCTELEPLLGARLAGSLKGGPRAELARHLERCVACAALLAELEATPVVEALVGEGVIGPRPSAPGTIGERLVRSVRRGLSRVGRRVR
jgi:anti-sigma factor RsiW